MACVSGVVVCWIDAGDELVLCCTYRKGCTAATGRTAVHPRHVNVSLPSAVESELPLVGVGVDYSAIYSSSTQQQ